MDRDTWLAERFEQQRDQLRALAYRMLGSLSEADDALQEAWLRARTGDLTRVENVGGWLTTVVSRVCLNMLRARRARREESLEHHLPDPIVTAPDDSDPELRALTSDAVGLAMMVVLEALSPAERVAFVLHDMFAFDFEEVGAITERSPPAARKLASRARQRVERAAVPDPDPVRQRSVVDAFGAAAQNGDLDALLALLDPEIVLREDDGATPIVIRGARRVADRAMSFAPLAGHSRPVLVNGAAGAVVAPDGHPFAIMAFTVRDGVVVEIAVLADPARVPALARAI